ncbi:unnamed protein product [Cyprideis torosa]|uniref:Uncharacterized protein n=1 Tax=Cyprideis torosa TaxID=163714 RepID=A0A7R8WH59_9CRUS|nr:unnamed protein product [Cyprideis torosa]CAG0898962.1 unnamed protein product [Cyprideis torosa]
MPKLINYTDEDLKNAIRIVREDGVSKEEASRRTGVPPSTIRLKLNTEVEIRVKPGPQTKLPVEWENRIYTWIKHMGQAKHPRSKQEILSQIQYQLTSGFKENLPTDGWWRCFLSRHPDLVLRKPELLGRERDVVTAEDIEGWFQEFRDFLDRENFQLVDVNGRRIFNSDESGFPLGTSPTLSCKSTAAGVEYFGQQNMTSSGQTCLRWDAHPHWSDSDFPEGSMATAENYCRNPNGDAGGPWCMVASGTETWTAADKSGNPITGFLEHCTIPECVQECPFPIAPHVSGATYAYSVSGPPYPKGTIVTITCSGNNIEAECLGDPYGWYIKGYIYGVCTGSNQAPCTSQPPEIPCARVKSALKPSYDHGDEVEYMTFVTDLVFNGARCQNTEWILDNTIPNPEVGLPQLVQSGSKCFYVVVNVKTTWHGAEEYCQDTVNGSLAMPESQHLLTEASLLAHAAGAKHLWVGPNILGADYVCSDNSADNTCRNFWNYVDGTRIPGDLFKDDQPRKDQKKLCLIIEANNAWLKNEDCYKDDKYPLCEVNAVFSPDYACYKEIDLVNDTTTSFTVVYDQAGLPYPRGTTANVTCTIENPNCQRTFQAECTGRYGWSFIDFFNITHIEFCSPCSECYSEPPESTPCVRRVEPNNGNFSHGQTVEYEYLGIPGLVNATCNDGNWSLPAIPDRYMEYGEKCYMVSLDTKNFVDAEKACQLTACFILLNLVFEFNLNLKPCPRTEPGDCIYPPPNIPCGKPPKNIHPAPFKNEESISYTCPVHSSDTQFMICDNGTWVGGCQGDPHIFAVRDECYVVLPGPDKIEGHAVSCNNLSEGYLAPAPQYPLEVANALPSAPPGTGNFLLGTHLTSNPEAYTCNTSQSCESLWTDEIGASLNITIQGENKACLVLNDNGGFASHQCNQPASAICRVLTGNHNSIMDLNCSCPAAAKCYVQLSATCYGYPVDWFYDSTPSIPCAPLFEFGDYCYSVVESSATLEDATMHCKNEYGGYVTPAISSLDFVQTVQEKYSAMKLNGPIIFSTHLTYNESAYTCSNESDCNSLWKDEDGAPLTNVTTLPGTHANKCLEFDVLTGTYKNQECLSPRLYICKIQPLDTNFECGVIPEVADHTLAAGSQSAGPYEHGITVDVEYSCACGVNGTGTVPAVCLGYPANWLFPQGIHICPICTTTESTTQETTTESTTLETTTESTTLETTTESTTLETTTESTTLETTTESTTLEKTTDSPTPPSFTTTPQEASTLADGTPTDSPTPTITGSTTTPSTTGETSTASQPTSTAAQPKLRQSLFGFREPSRSYEFETRKKDQFTLTYPRVFPKFLTMKATDALAKYSSDNLLSINVAKAKIHRGRLPHCSFYINGSPIELTDIVHFLTNSSPIFHTLSALANSSAFNGQFPDSGLRVPCLSSLPDPEDDFSYSQYLWLLLALASDSFNSFFSFNEKESPPSKPSTLPFGSLGPPR